MAFDSFEEIPRWSAMEHTLEGFETHTMAIGYPSRLASGPAEEPRSPADAGDVSGSVPLMEMDLTNKVFLEWYVRALGQAAEDLIAVEASPVSRRAAALMVLLFLLRGASDLNRRGKTGISRAPGSETSCPSPGTRL
jgi:hypothetical protein